MNPKGAHEYQQFFRISRWVIELVRVVIIYEVSLLSSHLAMTRKVQMEALMVIFFHLDRDYGKTIIIDPMILKVNTSMKIETNWIKKIYCKDNQEEIPANKPKPLGNLMSVNVSVDSSHSVEKLTICSHTGILIYVNNAPIDWFSKRKTRLKLLHLVLN